MAWPRGHSWFLLGGSSLDCELYSPEVHSSPGASIRFHIYFGGTDHRHISPAHPGQLSWCPWLSLQVFLSLFLGSATTLSW